MKKKIKKYFAVLLPVLVVSFICLSLINPIDTEAACCVSTCVNVTSNSCTDGSTPVSGNCTSAICSGSGGGGGAGSGASGNTSFPNPLSFNTIEQVMTSLLSHLQGVIATLAIIFIVLGGILYMTAAGNEKRITVAKACITGAIIGLAITLAAPSFLKEIRTILGASGSSSVDSAPTIKDIAIKVLNLLLSILGIIAIISLVIAGGMYLTAYGDEKRIETAKKMVTYSVIGIVVALGALVIVKQVATLIGT